MSCNNCGYDVCICGQNDYPPDNRCCICGYSPCICGNGDDYPDY